MAEREARDSLPKDGDLPFKDVVVVDQPGREPFDGVLAQLYGWCESGLAPSHLHVRARLVMACMEGGEAIEAGREGRKETDGSAAS